MMKIDTRIITANQAKHEERASVVHMLEKLIEKKGYELKLVRLRKYNDDLKTIFFDEDNSIEPMDYPDIGVHKAETELMGTQCFARESRGHCVFIAEGSRNKNKGKTVVGRSICSSSDRFNGDLAKIFALQNILKKVDKKADLPEFHDAFGDIKELKKALIRKTQPPKPKGKKSIKKELTKN